MAIRITDKEIKKIENSLFDTEMMKKLYKFRSNGETVKDVIDFELMDDLGLINTERNSTDLIEFYDLDDLSKPKYLEVRKKFANPTAIR